MTDLPVHRAIRPESQRVVLRAPAEYNRDFQRFRELLKGKAEAPVTLPELTAPPSSLGLEGQRSRAELGSATLDADERRRISADPPTPVEPSPNLLEPFAVLLGSLGAFEVRATEVTGAVPDRLVSDVVRAISWGGNQRRGAARIELGGERYGGTRLLIEVDGDQLWLRVDAPPGVDTEELRARLAERLARRGLCLRDD